MDHIDAILYINLEYRKDRNEHILNEIHKICTDDSKIHRIDAIKTKESEEEYKRAFTIFSTAQLA